MGKKGSRKLRKQNNRQRWVIGGLLLLLVGVIGGGSYMFAIGGEDAIGPDEKPKVDPVEIEGVLYPAGVGRELFGKTSTLNMVAYDMQGATEPQVATTGYLWVAEWNTLTGEHGEFVYEGAITFSATAKVTSTVPNVGDLVKVIAFNGTYPYGKEKQMVITSQSPSMNLDVHKGSASQSISWYDENGDILLNPTTTGNVTVGTTNYRFDKLRVKNTDDYSLFNTAILGFDYAQDTNISTVLVSGLTVYNGPAIKRLSGLDEVYVFEEELNNKNNIAETGTVTIIPDGDNVVMETLTAYILDEAPYVTVKKQLEYGVQDDTLNRGDVGIADLSQSILLT